MVIHNDIYGMKRCDMANWVSPTERSDPSSSRSSFSLENLVTGHFLFFLRTLRRPDATNTLMLEFLDDPPIFFGRSD